MRFVRFLFGLLLASAVQLADAADGAPRPNFLFAIADDWGWPHAGAYGDAVVQTPAFDRVAREGVLFHHAYVSSPSCTPSRNAILTGQWHWRLGSGANLWSVFPARLTTYPERLAEAGYQIGSTRKSFGPGKLVPPERQPAGKRHENFERFLASRDEEQPFCFWLGSSDPHRPYDAGSGVRSGIELSEIEPPACLPDDEVVLSDIADYYWEVQRFDREVGRAVEQLKQRGLWENTVVVVTGDHGMPFPRCKANLYDTGTRVPLAVSWPAGLDGVGREGAGRETDDFVSLTDLAPTFLELAGVAVPDDVTGRSLVPLLRGEAEGDDSAARRQVLFGMERHTMSQAAPDRGGYPCRGLRTHKFLYLRNYTPERWPAGTPEYRDAFLLGNWYSDSDNGPTKAAMIANRDSDATHRRLYELAFGKRPAEELYDLRQDPDQLHNVAGDARYAPVREALSMRLTEALLATDDPRVQGHGAELERHEYYGHGQKHPDWVAEQKAARRAEEGAPER